MKYSIIFTFLFVLYSNANEKNICTDNKYIISSLNNLKNYGLASCFQNFIKERDTKASSDIGTAAMSYYKMTNFDLKSLESLDTKVSELYNKQVGVLKQTGNPNVFMRCLNIYNSNEYNEFVKKQLLK